MNIAKKWKTEKKKNSERCIRKNKRTIVAKKEAITGKEKLGKRKEKRGMKCREELIKRANKGGRKDGRGSESGLGIRDKTNGNFKGKIKGRILMRC